MSAPISSQPKVSGGQAQSQHSTFRPWVTFSVLLVILIVFVLQSLTQTPDGTDPISLYGAKINEYIDAGEFWRLFTPIFLHVSLMHVLINMYALFVIGPPMERFFGHQRFTLLFFLSGISGNVVSYYLSPNPAMGASTALFGLIAAETVFIIRNKDFFGNQARGFLRNMIIIVVINLALGLMPGIDNWGHIGGLMGGIAFSWSAGPLLTVSWNPEGGYVLTNQVSMGKAWLVSAAQLVVLAVLVVVKAMVQ